MVIAQMILRVDSTGAIHIRLFVHEHVILEKALHFLAQLGNDGNFLSRLLDLSHGNVESRLAYNWIHVLHR